MYLINKKISDVYVLPNKVELIIPKGTGLNKTAALLEQNGVIDNALLFVIYARYQGVSNALKAGEYLFEGETSLSRVINKLVKGDVVVRSLTIPEGKALVEILKIVYDTPYLSGEITLALKEGEILPETYHFTRGEQRDNILKKARQAMKKTLSEIYDGREKNLPLKDEQELLILASIVEKETGVVTERAKVASVFVNRLNIGMRLQTDPTVIYAVTDGQMNLGRSLLRKDLSYDSPFNTYVYEGLPPAPICSPGREALWAAAHPEQTKYLYFVADGLTGGHRFATSLSEHNKNVALYRKALH